MTLKTELRKEFLHLRKSISKTRREKAAEELTAYLKEELKGPTLSFASFGSEIDTTILNQWLADQNFLCLPRVEGVELSSYLVRDLQLDLIRSKWGILEPDPNRCEKVDFKTIQTALVAGLAFDTEFYRLGYGQGHYDRILPKLSCPIFGVAFLEQKTDRLPHDPWDIPMDQVLYF